MTRRTNVTVKGITDLPRTTKVLIEFSMPKEDWDINQFHKNKKWLAKHLFTWAGYDHSYTLNLFCDSLEQLGKELGEYNHLVTSQKNSRRAIFAAKSLRKCISDDMYEDKSFLNWSSRNRHYSSKIPGRDMYKMTTKYLCNNAMGMPRKEYSAKMFKVINRRFQETGEKRWSDVWDFIKKHIRGWWD